MVEEATRLIAGWLRVGQAILLPAKQHGLAGRAKVTCEDTLNTEGGFSFAASLKVSSPGVGEDKLKALAEEFHQVCPNSKAASDGMPVTLTVA